jgi:MFS family permease
MSATKDKDIHVTPDPVDEEGQVDLGAEKLAAREVDAALQFLRQEQPVSDIDPAMEKKLLHKIDLLVMPPMFGAYLFQYMDKSLSMSISLHFFVRYFGLLTCLVVNYANVMGMSTDLNMNAAQFSYLATFFFVTFFASQPLHGYLMQKVSTSKYLGVNVIIWGIIVACALRPSNSSTWRPDLFPVHCIAKNFGGIVTLRVLLGIFEAAVTPCLMLITGAWYKRSEQPLRIASWYLGVGSGTIIGALSSYGFQFYVGKVFKSWQVGFIPPSITHKLTMTI